MSNDKLVEAVRDAIMAYIEYGIIDQDALARAALAAIEAEGCRVVPVEPTEAMLDAGGSSVVRPSVYMGGTPPGAMRRARDIWAAMLAAAKAKEQPT